MNKKLLSITIASAGLVLAACGGKGGDTPVGPSFPAENEDGVHTVAINNAEEMSKEWEIGGSSRQFDLSIAENGQARNVVQELSNGNLKFVVKDSGYVTNTGLKFFSGDKVGSTTVAVVYKKTVKHLQLTFIKEKTCKEKYGTEHEGTLKDPLSNEDAIKVTKNLLADDKSTQFYVKGVVDSFYHSVGERSDKVVSWFLQPAVESGERFEVYKCLMPDGKSLSDNEIWKGAIVTAHGSFTTYSGQCETTSAVYDKTEGEKPDAPKVIESNVDTAVKAAKELSDGDGSWDYYNVTGYVVGFDGSNYYMNDAKSEKGTTSMLQLNQYHIDGIKELLKYNAKITVKTKLKNYHGQPQTLRILSTEDVVVIEEGEEWIEKPEPEMKTGTIAEFIADTSGNGKQLYEIKGKVTKWVAGNTDGTIYGNFYLSDDDGATELYVYGATASKDALAWNKYGGVYKFTNPKDFLSNSVTGAIKIGDTVKMHVSRCDYKETIEANGIVTKVGDDEELTGFHFEQESYEAPLNRTLSLNLVAEPEGAEIPLDLVKWASTDETVATVANGVVTPVAKGTCDISATLEDAEGKVIATATTNVKVTDPVEGPVIEMNSTNFLMLDPSQSSGYAKYNGDHTYGDYTVTSKDVMVGGINKYETKTIQIKKTSGSLKIASIEAKKVTFELISTFDFEEKTVLSVKFAGNTYTLTAEQAAAVNSARVEVGKTTDDTPKTVYSYTYTLEINAAAAGSFEICGNGAGASYCTRIAIY